MSVSLETIRESVKEARKVHEELIQAKLQLYEERQTQRRERGLKVVAFLGHGRAGKDESANIFAKQTGAIYAKSTSWVVCPIIAHSLGVRPETAWNNRHSDRMYWKVWCDAFRADDATIIAKMLLADSDIIVGIRGKPEFYAVMGAAVAQHAVWLHRDSVDPDSTMDYTYHDLQQFPQRHTWLDNSGSLNKLEVSIGELIKSLGIKKEGA